MLYEYAIPNFHPDYMSPHFRMEPFLDRRSKYRYPIQFDLEYRTKRGHGPSVAGVGHTINISSHGLLFRTSEKLAQGSMIEAVLNWPITLDDRIPLKLTIKGAIIRSELDAVAVQIVSYEFRTGKPVKRPVLLEMHAATAGAGNS